MERLKKIPGKGEGRKVKQVKKGKKRCMAQAYQKAFGTIISADLGQNVVEQVKSIWRGEKVHLFETLFG